MDLAALPFPLRWLSLPAEFDLADEALAILAGPRCDWFIDPDGVSEPVLNAPALVGEPQGDFMLSARVTVDFAATFDEGRVWQLIRYFGLDPVPALAVGFEAQSPVGDGCPATFDAIRFEPGRLADLRNGS